MSTYPLNMDLLSGQVPTLFYLRSKRFPLLITDTESFLKDQLPLEEDGHGPCRGFRIPFDSAR